MTRFGPPLLVLALLFFEAVVPAHAGDQPSTITGSSEDLRSRAQSMESSQRFDEAIVAYRAYLDMRPEDDEIRAALARVLSWQGRYDESLEIYQDILSRHPVDLDVLIAVGRVQSWRKNFAEARAIYENVLLEDPTNLDAEQGLADTLYWSGDFAAALRHYQHIYTATSDRGIADRIVAVQSEINKPAPPPEDSIRAPTQPLGLTPRLPFRDYFKTGYSHYTTNNQTDERNWLVEAAKPLGQHTLVARVEALNRFGLHDTPISGELYSPLWAKAWGYVTASAALNPKFSPNYTLGGELFQGLGIVNHRLSFLEASFGYRRLAFPSTDIDLLTPGLTLFLPFDTWLTEKLYYVPDTGAMTLSTQFTWRVHDRLQVFASGAFGTSGERISAAQDFTRVTSRIIQAGIIGPLAERLSFEAGWYYEDRETLFVRRGGTIALIVHW